MIELGVLGAVLVALTALVYKVVSLFKMPVQESRSKAVAEELQRRNEANFNQVKLVQKASKEREEKLLARLKVEGPTSQLIEELEAEQERLRHELASLDLDR